MSKIKRTNKINGSGYTNWNASMSEFKGYTKGKLEDITEVLKVLNSTILKFDEKHTKTEKDLYEKVGENSKNISKLLTTVGLAAGSITIILSVIINLVLG